MTTKRDARGAPGGFKRGTAVKRSVALKLGSFATRALVTKPANGSQHGGDGKPTANDIRRAIRFYLDEKEGGRASWPYVALMRDRLPGGAIELELEVNGELWHAMEAEATSQQVPVERLVEHAAFYYAAALDAGRVTTLILDRIDED